jgi:hypothetical protein
MNMMVMKKGQSANSAEPLFIGMPPLNRFLQDVWAFFTYESHVSK